MSASENSEIKIAPAVETTSPSDSSQIEESLYVSPTEFSKCRALAHLKSGQEVRIGISKMPNRFPWKVNGISLFPMGCFVEDEIWGTIICISHGYSEGGL